LSFLAFGHRVLAGHGFHGLPDPVADGAEKIIARTTAPAAHQQLVHRVENSGADLVQELLFRDGPGDFNLIGHFAPAFSFRLSKTVNTP
jgi:hypothetical protein